MSLNLFLPKTFKPARWKRLDAAPEFEFDFKCSIPPQQPITLHSEPITLLFGSREEGEAYLRAVDRYTQHAYPRTEMCTRCGSYTPDWVDPDWAKGRICRDCETRYQPTNQ